jgi:hypothetical protein
MEQWKQKEGRKEGDKQTKKEIFLELVSVYICVCVWRSVPFCLLVCRGQCGTRKIPSTMKQFGVFHRKKKDGPTTISTQNKHQHTASNTPHQQSNITSTYLASRSFHDHVHPLATGASQRSHRVEFHQTEMVTP